MSYQNLPQQIIGMTLVTLFLVGCGASVATPTPVPPTMTLVESTETSPSPTETPTPSLKIDADIVYANVNDWTTKLDVYAPEGSGPWPVAIVVHGMAQSKSDSSAMSEGIAEEGVVVYNINVNHNPPYEPSIHRIACAARYARATAKDYDGDPEWMILVGHSAGALTGLIVALAGDDFGDQCVVEDSSALVDAFVGFEGVYEFITTVPPDSMKFLDFTYLEEEDPELWLALNPYTHIGRNPNLKVRLVHGDFIESSMMSEVPIEWSTNLRQNLEDANYDVELIIVEGADHDDVVDPGSDAFKQILDQVTELARNPSQ
jgi:acetyl esterase/lipase